MSKATPELEIRAHLEREYDDVYTPEVLDALHALAGFNEQRRRLMRERIERRARRARAGERIAFLDPGAIIAGTDIGVQAARDGRFAGSEIPHDLQRQWIQGTGPGAKPNTPVARSIRNVAYALLSGADGWMFDGEDALGQITTMSLDNQRNLRLAIAGDDVFLNAAEQVAAGMNALGTELLPARHRRRLAGAVGVYHQDLPCPRPAPRRPPRARGRRRRVLGIDRGCRDVRDRQPPPHAGAGIVDRALPAQDPDRRGGGAVGCDAGRPGKATSASPPGRSRRTCWSSNWRRRSSSWRSAPPSVSTSVGFNTGRWDYINSVADAMAWDGSFINPNIDAILMTYGYMRNYEDRVRRAVNTADMSGNYALWQGGMEPNIPVGSEAGVEASMNKAVAGGEREQQARRQRQVGGALEDGAHRAPGMGAGPGEANQLGRAFPALTYTDADAAGLTELEAAPRTVRGARDLLSVALQYGNAFGQGMQAAALKPARLVRR